MKEIRDDYQIQNALIESLHKVIDPETGVDVIRMQLVDNIMVSKDGHVSYIFRPSSPLCPLAVFLAKEIKQSVASVPGITGQLITVTDYVQADELTKLINQEK